MFLHPGLPEESDGLIKGKLSSEEKTHAKERKCKTYIYIAYITNDFLQFNQSAAIEFNQHCFQHCRARNFCTFVEYQQL
jgi:hypothetical protein